MAFLSRNIGQLDPHQRIPRQDMAKMGPKGPPTALRLNLVLGKGAGSGLRHSAVGRDRCPGWVKLRNTQHEQMSSAVHPTTDMGLARAKGVTRIDGVWRLHPLFRRSLVMEWNISPIADGKPRPHNLRSKSRRLTFVL
jgi:hypothetical protein